MKLDLARLKRNLAAAPRRELPTGQLRPAAVLVLLFRREDEDWLLLTRRAEHLPHHRGEIAFPGGGCDPGDVDRIATALRETDEEMGVGKERVELLGCLDDFVSVHNYHVLPVVGLLDRPGDYQVDPSEVADVIELPVRAFLAPGVHHQENWIHRGRRQPVDFYRVEGHDVWGLTAAILRQLLQRSGVL